MVFDDEVPAGFRDADIEQAGLEAKGRRSAALKRAGICDHGWVQGTPGADGPVRCLDCGEVFATDREWWAAHKRVNP